MLNGLPSLVYIGATVVFIGFIFLLLLVRYDLAPVSRIGGPKRWLLAAALGTGLIAFSIKLLAIALIGQMLPMHIDTPMRPPVLEREAPPDVADRPPPLWFALPEIAAAPANNPTTAAKVVLGRMLFQERRLSRDGTIACVSCHNLDQGGADTNAVSLGVNQAPGSRNAPSVYNAAFQKLLFWDGRARSLEEQALGPLFNPSEMAMPNAEAVIGRLHAIPEYRPLFESAFANGRISIDNIAKALAAFQRTLVTPDTPYDRFVKGDTSALSAAQLRGMALFQETGCIECHAGPNFSEASVFSKSGAGFRYFPAVLTPLLDRYPLLHDKGAGKGDRGVFRVPSLRNVALTGPYLHNGSVADLREVVRIMATSQRGALIDEDSRAGREIIWQPDIQRLQISSRRVLASRDVDDIVQFLNALTSERLARH